MATRNERHVGGEAEVLTHLVHCHTPSLVPGLLDPVVFATQVYYGVNQSFRVK